MQKTQSLEHSIAFCFQLLLQYLPFLTRFFERNVCFPKKKPLM